MVQHKNKILIIGSGGREHCLAEKFSKSPKVDVVYVAPGVCSFSEKIVNVDINSNDVGKLVDWSIQNNVDLIIPGGEQLLIEGAVDAFKKVGLECFGPTRKAARLEGSKAFAKEFMSRHNIPTAKYQTFTDYKLAARHVKNINYPVVIKASGPAAGKGVFLPNNYEEVLKILNEIMLKKCFGSSGNEVVIEQRLEGEELSVMCFCDGYTIKAMKAAQDHKRIYDNDQGPNTGGMEAYCPVSLENDKLLMEKIEKEILEPTIKGMRKENTPFKGVLFVGLMIIKEKPFVIEYNVRFGDPETQVVIPLLEDDIFDVTKSCIDGTLDNFTQLRFLNKKAVTVVASANGYPNKDYEKGKEIIYDDIYFDKNKNCQIYFAGASLHEDKKIYTNGGRVFAATGFGNDIDQAARFAYESLKYVKFENMHYRKDISSREKYYKQKIFRSTYKDAGVNIDEASSFISLIKTMVKSTKVEGALSDIGGFGGIFDMSKLNYKDPLLVSSTDGVGTKLLLSMKTGKYNTIGIDLVAMSVNDLIVQGAQPLFFLDYYSTGKLESSKAAQIIEGIVEGCKKSSCALIGGETAEMSALYNKNEYDLAGFCVGAVERNNLLPKINDINDSDVIIGISSSGIHSNGYSLVHSIVKKHNLLLDEKIIKNCNKTLGEILMEPTRIYVDLLMPLFERNLVKALSHITGGGIIENLPRVLPNSKKAIIDINSWKKPPIFNFLKLKGNVDTLEMLKTFNCGIGMVLIVANEKLKEVHSYFENKNEHIYNIGFIRNMLESDHSQVKFENLEKACFAD